MIMMKRLAAAICLMVLVAVLGVATASAFDATATAARMKELGIKPDTYKEPTPQNAAEASHISFEKIEGLTDADIRMIAALPKLNLLGLRHPDVLRPDRLRVLMAAPGLTRLNLYGMTVTDEALAIIATASKVRAIDMRTAKGFSPAGIGQLARIPTLGYLQLDDTMLGDDAFAPFASHPAVLQFDLSRAKGLTDKVLDHLGSMPKLGYLHAQNTGLTLAGFARMKNARAIKRLRIDGISVKPEDLSVLGSFSGLFQLSISEADVDDRITAVLPKLPTLRELNVRKTRIGDATISALATNKELVTLNIAETGVSDAAFRGTIWPDLDTVNAAGTKLTDAVLADVIRQPKLNNFYAERTTVTKDGIAKSLAARPANLSKLRITN